MYYYVFILHKPLLSNVDFYESLRPFLIIKKILYLLRRLNNVRSHRLRRKLFISNDSFHKVTQMTGTRWWWLAAEILCLMRIAMVAWLDWYDALLYWVKQMANHIAHSVECKWYVYDTYQANGPTWDGERELWWQLAPLSFSTLLWGWVLTNGVVVTTETRCMFCHAAAYKISPHLCTGWVLSDKYPSCIHLLSAH